MPSFPTGTTGPSPVEPQLVRIPQGWFEMGSETGQDNERPVHRVWVDEFLLASCAVTNAGYAEFVRATGNPPAPFWENPEFNHPQQPVVAVSWFEAVKYCEWLSRSTGRFYRLPTEAEWERAARGGSKAGSIPGETIRRSPCPTTKAAGSRAPNRWLNTRPIYSAFTTSARTFTSGAATGIRRALRESPERNPTGPGPRRTPGIARRLLAPSHQSQPVCRPLQHPARIHYADYGFAWRAIC